ncbi:MAG: hypothetical protein U0793_12210 [Gemmataceae bacterium]
MNEQRFLIAGLAAGLIVLWIYLARRPLPAPRPGDVVLSYRGALRIFAWLAALAIPVFLIAVMLGRGPFTTNPLPLGATLLAAGFVAGLLVLETERVRIGVNHTGIRGLSPWRRRREFGWHQIKEIRFSGLNRWFVVIGPEEKKIRVSCFLGNVKHFVEKVKEHVPAEKYQAAVRGFGMV